MGVLPCYRAGVDGVIDLCGLPPVVAEVYVLDILASFCNYESSR